MKSRPAGWALALVFAAAGSVAGQNVDDQGGGSAAPLPAMTQQPAPSYPDQPVAPQNPSLQRRAVDQQYGPPQQPAGPQNASGQSMARPNPGPPKPPFVLTPAEEAQLDGLLLFWQQSSQNVKTFRAKFRRFEYNPVEAGFRQRPPEQPIAEDSGELRYEAPDKGLFSIDAAPNGDTSRVEKWVCNGKSLFQYDFPNKLVREYKLPPEVQGAGITNGPMPFLFGAKADQLKRRYWLRMSPQQPANKNEIVLEVHPKFAADAQNFKMVEVILAISKNDAMPTAVQIYLPGGNDARTVYAIDKNTVNHKDLRGIFEDPFGARVPSGWQKVVEDDGQLGSPGQPRTRAGAMPSAMGNRGAKPR